MRWNKQKIITLIKERSTNGIAPSSKSDVKLLSIAQYYFGSWIKACRAAGVQPRNIPAKGQINKSKTPRIARLAVALYLAKRHGKLDFDTITKCIDLVRQGYFDNVRIV